MRVDRDLGNAVDNGPPGQHANNLVGVQVESVGAHPDPAGAEQRARLGIDDSRVRVVLGKPAGNELTIVARNGAPDLILHEIKAADLVANRPCMDAAPGPVERVLCQRHQKRRDAKILSVLVRVALRTRAQPGCHRDRVLLEHRVPVARLERVDNVHREFVADQHIAKGHKLRNRARLGAAHVVAHAPNHPRHQVWPLEAPVRVVVVRKVDKKESRRLGPANVGRVHLDPV